MKINVEQEDAVPQWRWPSEPSGGRLPSTGMGLFPFSKKKTRTHNNYSSVRIVRLQEPCAGGGHLISSFLFHESHQKTLLAAFPSLLPAKSSAAAVSVAGEAQAPSQGPHGLSSVVT